MLGEISERLLVLRIWPPSGIAARDGVLRDGGYGRDNTKFGLLRQIRQLRQSVIIGAVPVYTQKNGFGVIPF